MKKLLLLLLLPVCLLGQEDKKPRKLFLELKQGVGLPSIGIKYKNQKGNYWNVGWNVYSINPPINIPSNKAVIKYVAERGFYISYEHKLYKKFNLHIGVEDSWFEYGNEFIDQNKLTPYTGIFYGDKISIGLHVGAMYAQDLIADDWPEIQGYRKHNFAFYWFPKINFKIGLR